jgi:uncharacterized protein
MGLLQSPLSILYILFFLVAMTYSSVGFGGGTLYIAFLTFTGINYQWIPIIALTCNSVVVIGNCIHHYKQKEFNGLGSLPFVTLSIPAAFFGGYASINQETLCFLLAVALCISGLLLIFNKPIKNITMIKRPSFWTRFSCFTVVGGSIGFLSGMVGIGGGIILSPILYLLHLKSTKEITSISSIYILVNSLAGLVGQLMKQNSLEFLLLADIAPFLPLIMMVILGGLLGNTVRIKWLKQNQLRQLTGIIILIAAAKLFISSFLIS